MHKWAIPLAWVLGVGIAIAPGALATMSCGQCGVFHTNGRSRTGGSEYYVNLSYYILSFILPWVILMFPLLALLMQLCGARSPNLDFPYNRTAMIMISFILLYLGFHAPHDIYELMKMVSMEIGVRGDYVNRGMPFTSLETQMTLDALIFVPILLHPIIFILFNPEYREGFRIMWRNLYCNKSGSETQNKQSKYRNAGRPIIKGSAQQGGNFKRGGFRRSDQQVILAFNWLTLKILVSDWFTLNNSLL